MRKKFAELVCKTIFEEKIFFIKSVLKLFQTALTEVFQLFRFLLPAYLSFKNKHQVVH